MNMNITEALNILELSGISATDLKLDIVQKQYRKIALKCHPDKNGNTSESCKKFQELRDAYEIVLNMLDEDVHIGGQNDTTTSSFSMNYFEILSQFIKSTMTSSNDNGFNEVLYKKVIDIIGNYQDISVGLFENIDRDTSITIYQFLCMYKEVLYITDDVIEKVRLIIQSKFDELVIYTIEPSIDDILKDNVYKLNIDNNLYFVPLWHKEMYFDSDKGDILVICNPQIPPGYMMDENNNLFVSSIDLPFTSNLLENDTIEVQLPLCNKTILIDTSLLVFKKTQVVNLQGKGLLRINEKNIYNNSDRGDLIIPIRFT
jgi:hypothetical protein